MPSRRGGKDIMTESNDGYFSDESDFYGDEATRNELEARVTNLNVEEWWENRPVPLIEIARQNMEAAKNVKSEVATLYNPYEGSVCGRQLGETVEEFLARRPPATTVASQENPWIFIANPYRKAPKASRNQEEAPPNDNADWAQFVRIGGNLLQELVVIRHEIEKKNAGKAKGTATRAINKEKENIVTKILAAAKELHCTSGKWMIFPSPSEVNEVWASVARHTANNDLGIAAKVAPDNGNDRSARLVCIYTENCFDEVDVSRVLHKLKDIGLVEKAKAIFYKCDAYTYLGLQSNNEYNIKASMYSSKDFFDAKPGAGKQMKLENLLYKEKKDVGHYRRVDRE